MSLDMYVGRKIEGKEELDHNSLLGSWSGARAVHQWFVSNIQGGVNDCKPYKLTKEKAEELLSICKRIDDNPDLAHELLPSINKTHPLYDEYYYWDIENTIGNLEFLLLNSYFEEEDIYYDSSW
ncbi:hypothetical protein COF68_06375 [Bacillus toyonensis]|uniref:hypothetical protein n=1 Tax=Bacillus toyonensis TaxID=155322 RepID=UPI000BFBFA3D|nr:hypothetical protein [Bacillus toyonensis]PHE64460.1 hypothetical protein COF68_06375 [Bacillus toyonensis]